MDAKQGELKRVETINQILNFLQIDTKSPIFLLRKKKIPEWQYGLCDVLNKENKEDHLYNQDNTYCIHSCENQHVICNDQRIFL